MLTAETRVCELTIGGSQLLTNGAQAFGGGSEGARCLAPARELQQTWYEVPHGGSLVGQQDDPV